jgi:NADPH-dependent curcumin reductase CurA
VARESAARRRPIASAPAFSAKAKPHYDETIVGGGIEAAPDALGQLFSGQNMGKLLVRVGD